ncbi:activating signal cointegrator 1 complex subunit 3-like [Oncorhynchus mykiss]|uniref:activating signal cointegrator 1 complex subunit 3-like n=1 Tax=Oncorhynchus mykiss TaxID=8022 RepID=UPI001878972D|nr:activating signal cointegrator 1 complex subunit 3-like [Oncorhynchus mykiss]
MSPPRFTSGLRSFSTVSKQEDFSEEVYDLKTKRLKRQELFSREGLTWQKIVQFFTQHLEKAEQQAAAQELKSILKAAKQIGGGVCLFPELLSLPSAWLGLRTQHHLLL